MTQEEALTILKMGKSVFLTGAPGSGKTYVINKYIDFLRSCGISPAITASTGIAATHIGGVTIHSWSGIGIKDDMSPQEIIALSTHKQLLKRCNDTSVLIIDEISMLGARQFDLVDKVLRAVRGIEKPFGGMQIVLSGDFFQLPPITKQSPLYAYESKAWQELNPTTCYLETSFRHEDPAFIDLLQALREGRHDDSVYHVLQERLREDNDEQKTILYTHNVDVDSENIKRLYAISGEEREFCMTSTGRNPLVATLIRGCLAPERLVLRVGAQVIFVRNDQKGRYVNGTRGVVVDFEKGLPLVKTLSGKHILAEYASWTIEEGDAVRAEISQIPLRLAWALTIHKSQGMTLDEAYIDLSRAFIPGQGYVALSRVKSLSGLYVKGFSNYALVVDPRVSAVDKFFLQYSKQARDGLSLLQRETIQEAIQAFIQSAGGSIGTYVEKTVATKKLSTYEKTYMLIQEKKSLEEIALERGYSTGTILTHLERLLEEHPSIYKEIEYLKPEERTFTLIKDAFSKTQSSKLSLVKDIVPSSCSFEDIRLVRLFLQR